MSSIGTLNFIELSGPQIPALATMIEQIDRPGVDGTTFRDDALKAPAVQLYSTQWLNTLAEANSTADTYAALKGSLVTVVDDMGRTVNNVMVLDVRVLGVNELFNAVPAPAAYQVRAVWVLKPTD